MQSLELLSNNRLAVMVVTKDDFAKTGAGVPATENLINVPLQIATVEAALLFTEPPEGGPIRVSPAEQGRHRRRQIRRAVRRAAGTREASGFEAGIHARVGARSRGRRGWADALNQVAAKSVAVDSED